MKKRVLALALALMLALSLLPMAALAAEDEPTGEIVATPIEEPAEEPDEEPVEEPVVEPTPEPTPEPTAEPTSEPEKASVSHALEGSNGQTSATSIAYLDEDGVQQTLAADAYTIVTDELVRFTAGVYVVNGPVTINDTVTLLGEVELILCDGAKLTVGKGIIGTEYSLTIYGQTGGTGELEVTDQTASGAEAQSYGIAVSGLFVNGGKVTANGGTATASSGDAKSYGICADSVTVENGEVSATGGDATATDGFAYSYGICADSVTVENGEVSATGGDATATDGSAYSYGIYAGGDVTFADSDITATAGSVEAVDDACCYGIKTYGKLLVDDGEIMATAGNATAKGNAGWARSEGIYACNMSVNEGGNITMEAGDTAAMGNVGDAESYGVYVKGNATVSTGSLTATAGTAEAGGFACSNGICVTRKFEVEDGTITATAGAVEDDEYDICVSNDFILRSGTVQSGNAGGAIRVCAGSLAVSGGTVKLADGSCLYGAEVSNGVALGDLLIDGYAYWKVKAGWNGSEYIYTPIGFVALDGMTKLDGDTGEEDAWYGYYVKPCAHSTSDGVCAYCGKDLTAKSDATPAPTAKAAQSPQTGDEANVALYLALLAMSVLGVAVVMRKKAE